MDTTLDRNNDATLYVSVRQKWGPERFAAAIDISGPFMDAFEPVDVCDRAETAIFLRLAGNKNAHTNETVRVIRKKRENYAAILAKALTEQIIRAMEAEDTKNGYKPELVQP